MKKLNLSVVLSLFFSLSIFAQNWNESSESVVLASQTEAPQIRAKEAKYYELNFSEFYNSALHADEAFVISLPTSSGKYIQLRLEENQLMAEGLKANYPGIKTYNAMPLEMGNTWGKVELTPKGFRAMIFSPGKSTLFIDPVFKNSSEYYIVYNRDQFISDKEFVCEVGASELHHHNEGPKSGEPYNNCELKTYRLALAATGEYTEYHGGTVADALGAMATSMNRVSGVYERDFGVTFTIIENNDLIVYTDPNTDPYTNGNAGAMIGENQNNINTVIGFANYDIGHVFGTNSGGLAGLGVICSDSQKARGVTGSQNPIGDTFDIDYVAHEMGHQFGGNHSFNNSCNGNRNNSTAAEPGSGSTIMAYAGICPPNVQNNSDDYFHGINMEEIGIEIETNNCQVTTEIPNVSPVIDDLPGLIYIPASTPFSLAANASDADGDTLTYCWEQMDVEISDQPPSAMATGGPNFRSLDPVEDSVRYFPSLSSLVSNGPFTWERLPAVERQMSFRLTVRDNSPGAGCTQFEDMQVQVVGDAGPFEVQYPSDNGIVWQAFSQETVLWDVANTTADPINAQTVNIWMSTNNGYTYPMLLAENVPNSGSYTINVPNMETSIAKIMVQNSEGTFFDVSNNNFDIVAIENGFYFDTEFVGTEICQDETFSFDLELVEIGDYPETISLSVASQPDNANIALSVNQASAGESFTVTASAFSGTPAGEYILTINGAGGDFDNTISFPITVLSTSPQASQPDNPADNAISVPTSLILQWTESTEPGITYSVDVATDNAFTNIVSSTSGIIENSLSISGLNSATEYFWRVSNQNSCASSGYSETYSFTTYFCSATVSTDVPVEMDPNDQDTYSSELVINQAGTISNISVVGVEGEHERVSELTFRLQSPDGTQAILAANLCGLTITLESNGDVVVTSPSDIAGTYPSSGEAIWSSSIPAVGITAQGVLAEDAGADGDINDLCQVCINPEEVEGNIALINRGSCSFVQKVLNAQDAGAIAAVIINDVPGEGFFDMGGNSNSVEIPAVMISYEDGEIIVSGIGGNAQDFSFSFDDNASAGEIGCPPTDGGTYQPVEALSVFEGLNAQGTWTLEIEDSQVLNGGQLNGWGLNICYADVLTTANNEITSQVSLYPNPTSGSLVVDLGEYKAKRALLLDLSGRVLENRVVQNSRLEFNLSNYANGLYFIRLEGEGTSGVYKVVKGE